MRHWTAQQTTPLEVAVLLVIVSVVCILTAAFIYIAIMTVAWLAVLRSQGLKWRKVVFPDLGLLQRFRVEYGLALLTSAILTITLAEKDRVVDSVLALPPAAIDSALLANLSPLHRSPLVAFGSDVVEKSIGLGDLVRAPLNAGRSGEVREVFAAGVEQVLQNAPALHTWLTRWLPLTCVLVILGYLAWFSGHRIDELRRLPKGASGNVDSPYRDVLSRLSILGVCLGLLLVGPTSATDARQLADSAVAAARVAPLTDVAKRAEVIVRQELSREYLAINVGSADTLAREQLVGVLSKLDSLTKRLAAGESALAQASQLRATLDQLQARLSAIGNPTDRLLSLEKELQSLEQSTRGFGSRLDSVRTRLQAQEALTARSLVVVETDANRAFALYSAGVSLAAAGGRGKGAVGSSLVGQGTTIGAFWLPSGDYFVRADSLPASKPFSLGPGQARGVGVTRQLIAKTQLNAPRIP
jgi:hypothetical protein